MSLPTKIRFKTHAAVYLILKDNNENVLLSLRKNTGYKDGFWGLVSGHIEKGEPASLAMAREAKEEANIIINQSDLIFRTITKITIRK